MYEGLSAAAQIPLPASGHATPLPPPKYSAALFELPASIRVSLPEDRVEATELSLGLLKTTAEALDLTEERIMGTHNAAMILREEPTNRCFLASRLAEAAFPIYPPTPDADLNMALLQSGEPSNAELVGGAPRNFFSLENRFEVAPSLLGGEYTAPLRDASGNQIGALDLSELEEFLARFNNNTDQGLVQIRDFVRKLVQKGNSQPMGAIKDEAGTPPPKRQAPPGKLSAPTGHHPVGDSKGLLSGGDFLLGRTSDVELNGILLRYLPKSRADLYERAMDTKGRVEHLLHMHHSLYLPLFSFSHWIACIARLEDDRIPFYIRDTYRRYSFPPASLVGGSAIIDDPVYVRCEPIARRNGYPFLLAATFLANQADGSRRSYGSCRSPSRAQHPNPDVSNALADYGFTIFRYLADADGHPHLERSTPLPPGGVFFLESDGSVPLPISIEGHEFVLGAQRELATDDEEHPPASAAYELTTDPSAACIGLYRPQLYHPSSVVARDSFPLLPPSPHRGSDRDEDPRSALYSDYTEREGKG
eukprot:gene1569-952_t